MLELSLPRMGDSINVLLDDLSAFFWRLSQFPIAFQLLCWLGFSGGIYWSFYALFRLFFRKKEMQPRTTTLWWLGFALLGIPVVFAVILDARQKLFQEEALLSEGSQTAVIEVPQDSLVLDSLTSQIAITTLGEAKSSVIYAKPGMEVVAIRYVNPNAAAYLATIDLNYFEVELDTAIAVKELTSAFAKRFNCEIAVNGEAGTTPGLDAPLGQWTGLYAVQGKLLKNEDTDKRPILYFNTAGRAFYSRDREVVKQLSGEMYNAIWGRYDLILDGKEAIDSRDGTKDSPYPRTVMGMNQAGDKLYLLIVDGRKPAYSRGFTMSECAQLLLPLGCYNAMACDQGGSSCMYLQNRGIVNRPADGGERPVYTHFGLRRIN